MGNPKISIIMCNYNYANFLHDALGSIVNQTQPPFECIVIDDCSTDNSVEIIKGYQKDFPFIKLHQNEQNKGVMYTANHGLKLTKGNYIYFFSSDDFCSKDFIEKTTKLLIKYPNAGLCCSIPCFSKENGEFSHAVIPPNETKEGYISSSSLESLFEKGFFLAGHTAVTKKTFLLDVDGLIPELKWHCDWFALVTIGLRHGICFTSEKLAFMRLHSKPSYSSSFMVWKDQKKVIKEILKLLDSKQFKDVKDKFFRSKILLYQPYVTSYLILHCKYWFILSFKTWKDIIHTIRHKDLLEEPVIRKKINKFLKPFKFLFNILIPIRQIKRFRFIFDKQHLIRQIKNLLRPLLK